MLMLDWPIPSSLSLPLPLLPVLVLMGNRATKMQRLMKPTPEQVELIANALCDLADVKALTFYDYYPIVELRCDDGRVYSMHSLPGRVAGITTFYHHHHHHPEGAYWRETQTNQSSRIRLIDPTPDSTDSHDHYV